MTWCGQDQRHFFFREGFQMPLLYWSSSIHQDKAYAGLLLHHTPCFAVWASKQWANTDKTDVLCGCTSPGTTVVRF